MKIKLIHGNGTFVRSASSVVIPGLLIEKSFNASQWCIINPGYNLKSFTLFAKLDKCRSEISPRGMIGRFQPYLLLKVNDRSFRFL
ncbi:MAG: hypothetical protein ACR2O7_13990 [Parasphingorhabdus sp.]